MSFEGEPDFRGSSIYDRINPDLLEQEIRARISKLNNESDFYKEQALKEHYLAESHRINAAESQKVYDAMLATNSENRVYDFVGMVSAGTVENAMATLSRWRRTDLKPITVRFSSPGGNMIEGFAFYDFLLSLREDGIKVTTAVLGMAASMAGVLLQAGDERVVGPNAHILIHEVNVDSMGGKVSALEDETKFLRRLNVRSYEILAARAKLKVAAIETRAKRRDWWLTAEEAVELGFADRIGYVGANS